MTVDLPRILFPVEPAAFIRESWTNRARFIGGDRAKFDDLAFGRTVFRALCSGAPGPELIRAQYIDGGNIARAVLIQPEQVDAMFEAGMTICAVGLDRLHPPLARCAGAVKLGLNYPDRVSVSGYYSPDGAGFGLHFDSHPTFILQIEGEKRWRYSATPLVDFPPRNLSLSDPDEVERFAHDHPWCTLDLPDEDSLLDQVLRPGDVLYLPPGTCHRTYARGFSLSLTVACWRTSVLDLIWSQLARTLRPHTAWRQPLPAFSERPVDGVPLPSAVAASLEARLAELRDLVNAWAPASFASTLYSMVSQFDLPAPAPGPARPIRRRDRFELPHPITWLLADGHEGEQEVHLFAGNRTLVLPSAAGAFVRRLAQHREFRAEQALRWAETRAEFAWDEVREALEVLLERGIIQRSASARRPS
jgi:hypothetical protein